MFGGQRAASGGVAYFKKIDIIIVQKLSTSLTPDQQLSIAIYRAGDFALSSARRAKILADGIKRTGAVAPPKCAIRRRFMPPQAGWPLVAGDNRVFWCQRAAFSAVIWRRSPAQWQYRGFSQRICCSPECRFPVKFSRPLSSFTFRRK